MLRTKLCPFTSPDNKYGLWITLPFRHRPLWISSQHLYVKEPFLCATSSPDNVMALSLKQQMEGDLLNQIQLLLTQTLHKSWWRSLGLLRHSLHGWPDILNREFNRSYQINNCFLKFHEKYLLIILVVYLKGIGPTSLM